MVCCLLSNGGVATSFYQRFANYVFLFLRNLFYLILYFQTAVKKLAQIEKERHTVYKDDHFRDAYVLPIGHGIASMGSDRRSTRDRPRLFKVYWLIKVGAFGRKEPMRLVLMWQFIPTSEYQGSE